MCGIAGKLTFRTNSANGIEFVSKACAVMKHRGPDGSGYYQGEGIVLGHTRLAIIDPAGGAQPMSFGDGRYWITFNGEIYNYRELIQELESHDCSFRTTSDTEVAVAAYAVWGKDCVTRFNGIFAMAIWDSVEHVLMLARDHMGVKPLLYSLNRERLVFGSEIKALLQDDKVERTVSRQGLRDYVSMGYVLAPDTIVKAIQKLPAGNRLICKDGAVSIEKYWSLASIIPEASSVSGSSEEQSDTFFEMLEDAVHRQMVSDVPIGAYLSGGLDSSTIVNMMSSRTDGSVMTFSAGFDIPTFSELEYARIVARRFATEHHDVVMGDVFKNSLPELIRAYDEPLGDTSILPTYCVAQLAAQHVKVALSGDGGDENLAGYDTYLADALHRYYRMVPEWLHRNVLSPLVGMLPVSHAKVSMDYKMKQFIANACDTPERAHGRWRQFFSMAEGCELLGDVKDTACPFDRVAKYFNDVRHATPLNRALYVDMKTWLVDDILVKVDRASMACGLETRVPFLDIGVIKAGMRMHPKLKMRGIRRKIAIKQYLQNKLPTELINRKKQGFNAPLSHWLREDLRGSVESLFSRGSDCVNLDAPFVDRMWKEHLSGKADHGFKLWGLVSLLYWEDAVLKTARLKTAPLPPKMNA